MNSDRCIVLDWRNNSDSRSMIQSVKLMINFVKLTYSPFKARLLAGRWRVQVSLSSNLPAHHTLFPAYRSSWSRQRIYKKDKYFHNKDFYFFYDLFIQVVTADRARLIGSVTYGTCLSVGSTVGRSVGWLVGWSVIVS